MAGAATVGKLIIDMAADVAQLKTDMTAATQVVETAGKKIEAASAAAKGALLGMAAALGPAALAGMIESAIEAAAELDHLSQRTGATVESLSALKGVAKQSGTDMETVGAGLQKLSKTMLDAASGTSSAGKAFESLGLKVKDSQGNMKEASDFMQEVAQKLYAMESGTQRVAYAQEIFGKQGGALLPMLRDLADAGELQGKITSEQAAQADRFERQLKQLQFSMKGMFNDIAGAILPALNDLAQLFVENRKNADNLQGGIKGLAKDGTLKEWADSALVVIGHVLDGFYGVARVVEIVGKTIGATAAAAVAIAHGEFSQAKQMMSDLGTDIDAVLNRKLASDRLKEIMANRKPAERAAGDFRPVISDGSAEKAASEYDRLIKQIKEKIAVSEQELKSTVQLTEGEKERTKILESIQNGTLKLTAAQKANVIQLLDVMAADSRAVEAKKQAMEIEKGVKSWIEQSSIARAESAKQLEVEYALYGKSADARAIELVAIKAQSEAEKEIANLKKIGLGPTQEQTDAIRDEARARAEVEQATLRQTKALNYAYQLQQENKKYAAEMIADSRDRAAALLQIDAEMWQERIRLAGDGTEAQKKLQEEFNQWYANQLNKPVIDQWHKTIDQLDNDFHQGFRDMLTKGEGAWKSFTQSLGNTLKTALADALYETFIKKYVVQIVTSMAGTISGPAVANALGGGQMQGVGNMFGTASNAYSLFSGAGNSSLASTMNWLGYSNGAGAAINPTVHFSDAAFEAGMANASETGIATSSPALGGSIPVIGGALGAYYGAQKYGPVGGFAMGAGSIAAGGAVSGLAAGSGIMAGASAALAAIPVWGWAALAAMAILGSGGGETRYGGGYDVINGKVVLGGGPDGGEIQGDKIKPIIQATYDGLKQALKDLGSNASIDRFTAGLESSEKGKGATFAGGIINGQQFGSTYETTVYNQTLTQEQAVGQFTQKLQQSVLLALQAAGDIPKRIMDQLNAADIQKMSADQATALLNSINTEITAVKSFQTAIEKLPFENLKNLSFNAADGLIATAGGLDKLTAGLNTYYDKFFTAEEKTAATTKQVTEALASLGFDHLPKTREEFRAMVDSVKDLDTAAGQATYVGLLNLSGALDSILPSLQETAAATQAAAKAAAEAAAQARQAAMESAMKAVDAAFSALSRSVDAEKTSLQATYEAEAQAIRDRAEASKKAAQEQAQAAATSLQAIQSIFSSLDNALKTVQPMARDVAKGVLNSALATANAGGSLANYAGLADALQAVAKPNEEVFASVLDFQRDQARTANTIAALKDRAGAQVSVAQMTVDAINASITAIDNASAAELAALDRQHAEDVARLDGILSAAQAQIDAMNGVNTSVLSVAAALQSFNGAASVAKMDPIISATPRITSAYQTALGRNADASEVDYWRNQVAGGMTATQAVSAIGNSREAQIADLYRTVLGREPDAAGLKYQSDSGLSVEQIKANILSSDEYRSLPRFALGGDHLGGFAIAGEHGPELINTGPSRIFNASDTARILNGGGNAELAAEVRKLREEVALLRASSDKAAASASAQERFFRRISPDGNSINVTVAA